MLIAFYCFIPVHCSFCLWRGGRHCYQGEHSCRQINFSIAVGNFEPPKKNPEKSRFLEDEKGFLKKYKEKKQHIAASKKLNINKK